MKTLRLVAQAMLNTMGSASTVRALMCHMINHPAHFGDPRVAVKLLDAVGQHGGPPAAELLLAEMRKQLDIEPTAKMYEALLASHALAGSTTGVSSCIERAHADGQRITARGHLLAIRGLLQHGHLDEALAQAQEMRRRDILVPPAAVSAILRLAFKKGRAEDVLEAVRAAGMRPSVDGVAALAEECTRSSDVASARSLVKFAWDVKVPLCLQAQAALQLLCDCDVSEDALDLLHEVHKNAHVWPCVDDDDGHGHLS